MLPVFARATASVLARLAEDAVLRGTVDCKVNIERDVALVGVDGPLSQIAYGNGDSGALRLAQVVATIAVENDPKVGNTLAVGTDNYRLDSLIEDNGYSRRFVLLKV